MLQQILRIINFTFIRNVLSIDNSIMISNVWILDTKPSSNVRIIVNTTFYTFLYFGNRNISVKPSYLLDLSFSHRRAKLYVNLKKSFNAYDKKIESQFENFKNVESSVKYNFIKMNQLLIRVKNSAKS